ncbi:MAG TPA: shikimate dehydrogenase [Candidatus Brocadiia bacterium]|nr:shikimate dehydrogenase [Candidatus Brocadiia bacterium]
MTEPTRICVSVVGESTDAMLGQMAQAAPHADILELRLDRVVNPDIARLINARTRPVIATNRPVREGGQFRGSEEERVALLQQAAELGAEYVDIELDSAHRLRAPSSCQRIVSHHDFERTPADLQAIYERLVAAGADIAKIAVMATDIRDNLRVFDLLRSASRPVIALCMGELGRISRILAPKFGAWGVFASVAPGQEAAPGQIAAAELRKLYRFSHISAKTDIYGLIADPIAHSLSPHIQNAAFEAAGVDAVYVPFKVEGSPAAFLRDFRALGVRGYSVTIPHKEAVMPAMDVIEPLAARIGAVNTIVDTGERFLGSNTDYRGALDALESALGGKDTLRGCTVAILGAGGAGRALALGARDRGARVTILNRTHDRGLRLANEIGCEARPLAEFADMPAPDVLINTTRAGMWPDVEETPVAAQALQPKTFVYDSIYNPIQTRLLREAAERGCRTLSGVDWFIGQGAAQFELWTGQSAPREVMRRAMLEALGVLS